MRLWWLINRLVVPCKPGGTAHRHSPLHFLAAFSGCVSALRFLHIAGAFGKSGKENRQRGNTAVKERLRIKLHGGLTRQNCPQYVLYLRIFFPDRWRCPHLAYAAVIREKFHQQLIRYYIFLRRFICLIFCGIFFPFGGICAGFPLLLNDRS